MIEAKRLDEAGEMIALERNGVPVAPVHVLRDHAEVRRYLGDLELRALLDQYRGTLDPPKPTPGYCSACGRHLGE